MQSRHEPIVPTCPRHVCPATLDPVVQETAIIQLRERDVRYEMLEMVHHLIDEFLKTYVCKLRDLSHLCNGNDFVLGHSGQFIEEVDSLFDVAFRLQPSTVCEVGFNVGHSLATFMSASSNASYIGFDFPLPSNGDLNKEMGKLLQSVFPRHKLRFVWGKSHETVPVFFAEQPLHSEVLCNLVSVDGSHAYEDAIADLRNFRGHTTREHIIFADDVGCREDFCTGSTRAWNEMVANGYIEVQLRTIHFLLADCCVVYRKLDVLSRHVTLTHEYNRALKHSGQDSANVVGVLVNTPDRFAGYHCVDRSSECHIAMSTKIHPCSRTT
jgi:hypothetical protein